MKQRPIWAAGRVMRWSGLRRSDEFESEAGITGCADRSPSRTA
jgi:hypothetical protein